MIATKPVNSPAARCLLALIAAAGCDALTAGGAPASAPVAQPARPNVVLIVADDMGWNQVGYHGFMWYETPNIDRIATGGIQFRHAYAAAPICSPSRAAMLTGRAPARLHLTDYIPGNPHEDKPLVTPQQIPCLPLEETTIPDRKSVV